MASNYTIKDSNKYFCQIPNIIFDLGLPAVAIAIYCAIKRIGGDHGNCTKSISNLAKMCGIKETCLHKYLKLLAAINPILNKSLITIIHRKSESGDPDTNLIFITDIWPENMAIYGKEEVVRHVEGVVRDAKEGGSRGEGKEEPFKKRSIIIDNNRSCPDVAKPVQTDIVFSFSNNKFENITEEDLAKWRIAYPMVNLTQAIARMEEWLISHPKEAKLKKLWRKFITNWLSKDSEKNVNRAAYTSSNNQDRSRLQTDKTGQHRGLYENAF